MFGRRKNNDEFEKCVKSYLRKNNKSRKIWAIAVVAIVSVLFLQGTLKGGFDQAIQTENNDQMDIGLQNMPIINSINFAEEKEVTRTICVYDEFSKKGIRDAKIYLDGKGVGRTEQFGCSYISIPKDDQDHMLTINGKSLIEPFGIAKTVNSKTKNSDLSFYVNLYNDKDLRELALKMINDYRVKHRLPEFKQGNDLNAQKWVEFLHQNMMIDNGMMENAKAQLVQTHGYIKKLREVVCMKDTDCPPTFYAYSCESSNCTIERGESVKTIIDSISNSNFMKSKKFSYVSIGISYDQRVMFMVINLA